MDRKEYLQDLINHYEEHLKNKNSKSYFLNIIGDFQPFIQQELYKCKQELKAIKEIDLEVMNMAKLLVFPSHFMNLI